MSHTIKVPKRIPNEITHVAAINPDRSCIVALPKPNRHHHLFSEFSITNNWEQGFLIGNKFVSRKDAYVIAKENGQFARRIDRDKYAYDGDELFSEDLW